MLLNINIIDNLHWLLQNWEAVFFTHSHVDRVISLQDDRSLINLMNYIVLDTVFAKGRSCVFSLTGRTAL